MRSRRWLHYRHPRLYRRRLRQSMCACNAANWLPADFIASVEAAVHAGERRVLQKHYVPQPPDFPLSRAEPAYLKTVWLRIA